MNRVRALVVTSAVAIGASVLVPAAHAATGTPSVNAFAIPSAGPGTLVFFAVSGITPGTTTQPRLVSATDPTVSFAMASVQATSGGGVITPAGHRAPMDVVPGTYVLEVDPAGGTPVVSSTTVTIVAPTLTSRSRVAPGAPASVTLTGISGDPAIGRSVTVDGGPALFSVSEALEREYLPIHGSTTLTVTMPAHLAVGPHTLGFVQDSSPAVTSSLPFSLAPPSISVQGLAHVSDGGIATHDTVTINDTSPFGPAGASLSVRDASGHTYALPRLDGSNSVSAVLPGLAPGNAVFTAVSAANGSMAMTTREVHASFAAAGASLRIADVLESPCGHATLAVGWDGNVSVAYDGVSQWWDGVQGFMGFDPRLNVQADGNLVMRLGDNRVVWNSRTTTRDAPAKLAVTDDGRAVLTNAHGGVLWATPTAATTRLAAGDVLRAGARLQNERFALVVQSDGNVVLYGGTAVLFRTRTSGHPGSALKLQSDGNLVLYSAAGKALWSDRILAGPGARLVLQGDGNFVEYNASNKPVWSTATAGR